MKKCIVIIITISLAASGCSYWNQYMRKCGPTPIEIPRSPGETASSVTFDTCIEVERKAHKEAQRYQERYPQIIEALEELGRDTEFKALEAHLAKLQASTNAEDRTRLVEELEIAILDLIAVARTHEKLFKEMKKKKAETD